MLLILTPNPAIDRLLLAPGFRAADAVRVVERRDAAGGKGLNVARTARALGLPALVCAPLAGDAGRHVAALAAAEGIPATWHWLPSGETRTCLLVTDPQARDALTINEVGPQLAPSDWAGFIDAAQVAARGAAACALSGSVPPGVSAAQYVALLQSLPSGLPRYVDSSGAPLAAALDLPLALLKVNGDEIGAALGRVVRDPAAAYAAAADVRRRGPAAVIITLGALGAAAVDADGAWWARPPRVTPISAVGSGDALLAGVAAALQGGAALPQALRLGVACGAANTLAVGAGVVHPDDVARLQAEVVVEPLAP